MNLTRAAVVLLVMAVGACSSNKPKPAEQPAPSPSPVITLPPENPGPGTHSLAILVNGVKREFVLHAPPSYVAGSTLPAVFVFHGNPSTPEEVQKSSELDTLADAKKFLVIYPAGIGRWAPSSDHEFTKTLLDHVVAKWGADNKRLHAAGFSAGGEYTYHLAKDMPNRFGSVAPVSGHNLNIKTVTGTPPSLITFQGSEDTRAAAAFAVVNTDWPKAAGCGKEKVTTIKKAGETMHQYVSTCASGSEYIRYSIIGMAHSWPLGTKSSDPISASEAMWDFFVKHPLA